MNYLNLTIGNKKIKVKKGTTFKDVVKEYAIDSLVVLCELNGDYYELAMEIPADGDIKLIDANSEIGWKIYSRTLQYIFIKATLDIFKDAIIKIEHSISKGTFGEIYKTQPLNKEDINKIRKHMEDLIERDIPINKVQVSKEEAIKMNRGSTNEYREGARKNKKFK